MHCPNDLILHVSCIPKSSVRILYVFPITSTHTLNTLCFALNAKRHMDTVTPVFVLVLRGGDIYTLHISLYVTVILPVGFVKPVLYKSHSRVLSASATPDKTMF